MLDYPSPNTDGEVEFFGVLPVDFLLEGVLRTGLDWFRSDARAPGLVFGHLKAPWLSAVYGEAKIIEIADLVRRYDVKIVQHWSLISANVPCLSIQLLDGSEDLTKVALTDHEADIDVLDANDNVLGRTEVTYSPISDTIHIGIHNIDTPDLTKYLYYLVIYILNVYKAQLIERGLHLGTFRATDISRLNDFLPENMFSRFVSFTVLSFASFESGAVPILDKIIGTHIPPGYAGLAPDPSDPLAPSEEADEARKRSTGGITMGSAGRKKKKK